MFVIYDAFGVYGYTKSKKIVKAIKKKYPFFDYCKERTKDVCEYSDFENYQIVYSWGQYMRVIDSENMIRDMLNIVEKCYYASLRVGWDIQYLKLSENDRVSIRPLLEMISFLYKSVIRDLDNRPMIQSIINELDMDNMAEYYMNEVVIRDRIDKLLWSADTARNMVLTLY